MLPARFDSLWWYLRLIFSPKMLPRAGALLGVLALLLSCATPHSERMSNRTPAANGIDASGSIGMPDFASLGMPPAAAIGLPPAPDNTKPSIAAAPPSVLSPPPELARA